MKRYAFIKSFVLFFLLAALAGCGPGSSSSSLLPSDNPGGNEPPPIIFPPTVPSPVPTITTINAFTDRVELDWSDTSIYEDGFIIERDSAEITRTPRNISAWIDTSVQPGATYCYAVRSYNVVGKSVASPLECVTIPLPPPPPEPSKWILPEGAQIRSLAVNQTTGELYAAGMTTVALTDVPHNGREDEFLAKFSPDGTLARLQQWGTPYIDLVLGDFLAISNGNAYVLCQCNDFLGLGGGNTHITVFNSQGDILRIIDLGDVGAESITADDNGAYVVFGENNVGYIAKIDYQASDPIVWTTKMPGYVVHAKVYGGAIYVISAGIFYTLDTNNGNILQNAAWDGQHGYVDGSAIDASGVYLVGQGVFAPLTALKYSHDLASISTNVFSTQSDLLLGASPVLSDTSIYTVVPRVGLFCLNKNTLEVEWSRTDLDGSAVALISDTVLVARGNKFSRYNALTGESLP